MTTKTLYPKMDFESYDREFILTAYSVTKSYFMGNAGVVEMKFPVAIIDKKTNMICIEVVYSIIETSFGKEASVYEINRHQDTIDYIVRTEGGFAEPQPPKEEIVFKLLDRLIEYLQKYSERYCK